MSETLTDEELNAYAAGDFRPKSFFSVEFPDAVQSIASELLAARKKLAEYEAAPCARPRTRVNTDADFNAMAEGVQQ